MKKVFVTVVVILGLTFINGCTPDSITEDSENYDTLAIDKEEVEDPGDRGN